jgi:hypothetical protein
MATQTPQNTVSMSKVISEMGQSGWEHLYQVDYIPWDKGQVAPALAELIASGELPDGIAVVPGCGTGYDIAALASENRKVIGVEIAETAVARASKNIEGVKNAEIRLTDFFTLDLDGQVDLVYDYTFLCALPPSMRDQWADKIAALLKSGSTLVTLMFPLDVREGGPPFTLSVEIYKTLLEPRGFELTRLEENIRSFEARQGFEKLGIWKKKMN